MAYMDKKKYRSLNRSKIKDGGQIDTLTHKYKKEFEDTKGVIRIRKSKKIFSPSSTTFLV
jgi:hypothetical protein